MCLCENVFCCFVVVLLRLPNPCAANMRMSASKFFFYIFFNIFMHIINYHSFIHTVIAIILVVVVVVAATAVARTKV